MPTQCPCRWCPRDIAAWPRGRPLDSRGCSPWPGLVLSTAAAGRVTGRNRKGAASPGGALGHGTSCRDRGILYARCPLWQSLATCSC